MAASRTRRISVSDVLEGGAMLVLRRLPLFVRISAPLVLPVNALLIAGALVLDDLPQSGWARYLAIGALVALAAGYVLVLELAIAASIGAASKLRAGEDVNARSALDRLRPRLRPLIGLLAILLVGIAPGASLYVIARAQQDFAALALLPMVVALALATIWSVALPAFFVESLGAIQALERSRKLVRGRFAHALGVVFFGSILAIFSGVIVLIAASAIEFGSSAARSTIALSAWALGELLIVALLSAYAASLYDDLRAYEKLGEDRTGEEPGSKA